MPATTLRPALERRLAAAVAGGVRFDAGTRGRYATDASFYQVMPAGVVTPRDADDIRAVLALAAGDGVPVTMRGGGTSQSGQTVNAGLVVDTSRHLDRILDIDVAGMRCTVEPGVVLDQLNRALKPHGLWFPVDVSTASRATIGGMAGNNSCGTRSIRYGIMRDNVIAIDALMADGTPRRFAPQQGNAAAPDPLLRDLLALGEREADEIRARFPALMRRVGGYNIDALAPGHAPPNPAHLLVGSEGTLAVSTRLELKLSPLPGITAMGVCHFARFHDAMDAARHLVKLGPSAVELVDRTMIALAREIAMFRPTVERFVRGDPDALLIVEFAEGDEAANRRRLDDLADAMADLGYGWERSGSRRGGVVAIEDPGLQRAVTDVRQSGLNIMMSMKEEGKPVSFVEDCAVPLEHLADYTARLTAIFEKHGTRGTWYAHASVGCLHVRPVLNLRLEKDVRAMRAIAEEAFAMVREYKGSHSGEHGDGIVRSEFHEAMFGPRIVAAFAEVKARFDPSGLLNPGRIVDPPRMDDRALFRYPPDYAVAGLEPALDWSAWPGAGGGFQGAVEMCNNNGACRALAGGVMCPSYRATREERDTTRGRANTLRLAISGQLGPGGLAREDVADALSLCISCKACRRECPTGVDMARMKIEVQAARARERGVRLRDRLIACLPRFAPRLSRIAPLANAAARLPGARAALERIAGLSARRSLPRWRRDPFLPDIAAAGRSGGPEVVLFADTFTTWFEPETARAASRVLAAAGRRVQHVRAADGSTRPLCCGRTFLAAGLVEEARAELARTVEALAPYARRGVPVIGLEPSCLFTFRDELGALMPGDAAAYAVAEQALLFEEYIRREAEDGRLGLTLSPLPVTAYLHGHCHQKAFGALEAAEKTLRLVPDLDVRVIDSACCGMAGAFGYQAETYDTSLAMAELSLLPAVREAGADDIVVADGTSCRHQIADGTGRRAVHAANVLDRALGGDS